jgi:hypothetical protein
MIDNNIMGAFQNHEGCLSWSSYSQDTTHEKKHIDGENSKYSGILAGCHDDEVSHGMIANS